MTPSEVVKKVRRIEIQTRRLVTDAVAGAYHSSFKGRGMHFEEVREYVGGDDVRTIDWNVSARMDRPFVKVYREERELTLFLLLDLSASGSFGSVHLSKRERAAEIAAALAFSATYNNDKVGLILYTDEVEHYLPPRKGRRHILRLIRDILYHTPRRRGTRHTEALEFLNRVQKRSAVVFLLSDFLPEGDGEDRDAVTAKDSVGPAFKVTAKRHDLIAVRLVDPAEETLPDLGLVTFEDAETGEIVELDLRDGGLRERLRDDAGAAREGFAAGLKRNRIDLVDTFTHEPYLPALRELFARRARRL